MAYLGMTWIFYDFIISELPLFFSSISLLAIPEKRGTERDGREETNTVLLALAQF